MILIRLRRSLSIALALALFLILPVISWGTPTTISCTLHTGTGALANGTITVSWPQFTNASSVIVPSGYTTITVSGGACAGPPTLEPVDHVIPATNIGKVFYTAKYSWSGTSKAWFVPTSGSPVDVTVFETDLPAPNAKIPIISLAQLSPAGATNGNAIVYGTYWGPASVGGGSIPSTSNLLSGNGIGGASATSIPPAQVVFTSSSLSAGSTIYYNGSAWTSLGIGTTGYCMKSNGTAPVWSNSCTGGGGGSTQNVEWVPARSTVTNPNDTLSDGIGCDGTSTASACEVGVGTSTYRFTSGPFTVKLNTPANNHTGTVYRCFIPSSHTLQYVVTGSLTVGEFTSNASQTITSSTGCPAGSTTMWSWVVSATGTEQYAATASAFTVPSFAIKPSSTYQDGLTATLGDVDIVSIDHTTVPFKYTTRGTGTYGDLAFVAGASYFCNLLGGCAVSGDWTAMGGGGGGTLSVSGAYIYDGSSYYCGNPLTVCTPPTVGAFTQWTNVSLETVSAVRNAVTISKPINGSTSVEGIYRATGANTTFITYIELPPIITGGTNGTNVVVGFGDNSTPKQVIGINLYNYVSAAQNVAVRFAKFSQSAFIGAAAGAWGTDRWYPERRIWIKATKSGTACTFFVGNGDTWIQYFTQATCDYTTSNFVIAIQSDTDAAGYLNVLSYTES